MQKRTKNFIIFLLGLCLGVVVGVLSTPIKGSAVRSGLIYNLKSYQKKLQLFITKLVGSQDDVMNQAKNMGKEVITDVVNTAEKILEELDLLSKQLGQKDY